MDFVKRFSLRAGFALCLLCALCMSALATDTSAGTAAADISGVTDALTDGLSGLVPTILTAVGALAAVGLGIFAAKFAVRVGLQMFKSVTSK